MLNRCKYCGEPTERITRGLCPNCYAKVKNKGELDYTKRKKYKQNLIKAIDKLKHRLAVVEDAECKLEHHRGVWDTQFYIYITDRLMGKSYQSIAKKYGVTRQCVGRILSGDYYRRNEYEKKTNR